MPASTLGPEGGWIMRSHIDWRGERVLARMLNPERESPKKIISASSGLGRLHLLPLVISN